MSPQERATLASQMQDRASGIGQAPQRVEFPVAPQQPAKPVPRAGINFGESAKSLQAFGANLMAGTSTTYNPVLNIPVPRDYEVGPGDTVELQVFGKENRLYSLAVNRDGVVMLPDIGPLTVAGMNFESMSQAILERFSKQKIGVDVSVSMGPLRSIQVILAGDVEQPGTYTTHALTSVTNAVLVAGGIRASGSLRKIDIRRGNKIVARLDLYDVLLRGNAGSDLRLQSGDTVFVHPVGKRIAIAGAVNRPAIYEVLDDVNLDEALSLAGGLLPSAFVPGTKVERIAPSGYRAVVELGATTPTERFKLKNGDTVLVPNSLGTRYGSVRLAGAIERPGEIEFRPGMSIRDALALNPIKRSAWRLLAIVRHTDENSGVRGYRPVSLDTAGQGSKLEESDELFVLDNNDIEFLNSASVQYVLAGKLPPNDRKVAAGLLRTDIDVIEQSARSQVALAREEKLPAPQDTDAAKVDPDTPAATCHGLNSLAFIITHEGNARFRSAVLSKSTDTKDQLLRLVPCPAIFNNEPDLLAVVLEHAITVRGEVKQPGILAVAPGLPLGLALGAAGSLTPAANPKGIDLLRSVYRPEGDTELQRLRYDIKGIDSETTQLGDIVSVSKRTSLLDRGTVQVSGEVASPGVFDIRRGERLSELLARAGGLTQHAYSYGAIFSRVSVKEEKRYFLQRAGIELQNTVLMMTARQKRTTQGQTDPATLAAMKGLAQELKSIEPSGRIVVEADPTVLKLKPELDVVLEPGDEVIIPKRPSHVMVMGEVLNPGAVQFQSGLGAEDYLRAAGGLSQAGDDSRTYLILPNGAAEPLKIAAWNMQRTQIPPGSVIYVPRDPLPMDGTAIFQTIVEVGKDLALTAAALVNVSRN